MAKATPVFDRWRGDPPEDTYGGKQVLDFNGAPLFAELVILRHFETAGWQGAWIDTYRGRILLGMAQPTQLPDAQRRLLDSIYSRAGARHGCFDVFAWRDDDVLFAESKRAKRDRIRASQIRWLQAALESGVEISSLLVVEWSLAFTRV